MRWSCFRSSRVWRRNGLQVRLGILLTLCSLLGASSSFGSFWLLLLGLRLHCHNLGSWELRRLLRGYSRLSGRGILLVRMLMLGLGENRCMRGWVGLLRRLLGRVVRVRGLRQRLVQVARRLWLMLSTVGCNSSSNHHIALETHCWSCCPLIIRWQGLVLRQCRWVIIAAIAVEHMSAGS